MRNKNNVQKTDSLAKPQYGILELAILHILCQSDLSGLEFTNLISETTGGRMNIPTGSIFPALYQLIDAGYVSYAKDPRQGSHIYYHIEESGRQRLEELTRDYLKTNDAIQAILAYKMPSAGANS